MNGTRLAMTAWIAGACALLIADGHGWHVTLRDVVTYGTYGIIAISTTAFIAMMACCLYADYRVITHENLE